MSIDNGHTTIAQYSGFDAMGRKIEAGTSIAYHASTGAWLTYASFDEVSAQVASDGGKKAAITNHRRADAMQRAIDAMGDTPEINVSARLSGAPCAWVIKSAAGWCELWANQNGKGTLVCCLRRANGTTPTRFDNDASEYSYTVKLTSNRLANLRQRWGI